MVNTVRFKIVNTIYLHTHTHIYTDFTSHTDTCIHAYMHTCMYAHIPVVKNLIGTLPKEKVVSTPTTTMSEIIGIRSLHQ